MTDSGGVMFARIIRKNNNKNNRNSKEEHLKNKINPAPIFI
jgi:hypothetical protein